MKKSLLLTFLVIFYFLGSNASYSNIEATSLDNENKIEKNILISTQKYNVVEQDGQYAILDSKTGKNKLGLLADKIELFDDEFENEYKITLKNTHNNSTLTGYFNSTTDQVFITNYNEMYLLGEYLKVKSGDKYGLIDKTGRSILMPIFDRVGIYTLDGKDYLSVKMNGKNKLYSTDGKLIPEEELYTISYDGVYAIASDLKPEFKKYVIKTRKSNYLSGVGYQVEEVSAPKDVEVASVVENVVDSDLKEKVVDKVDKIAEEVQEEINTKEILVGKKHYIIKESSNLLGFYTEDNKEILPIEYNKLSITNLKNPIILAETDAEINAYNLSGKLIGKKVNKIVETYRFGKTYTYTQTENGWDIVSGKKTIGKLEYDGVEYKFTKNKFNLFKYNRLNDIFMALNNN